MRRWYCVCAALSMAIIGADVASGADVDVVYGLPRPVAAPFATWTGCYLGVNMGGVDSRRRLDETSPTSFTFSTTEQAFAGGGQAGCDYQVGPWVLGAQGIFDGTGIHGGASVEFPNVVGEATFFKESWFGTAAGRVGYTIEPSVLLYIKGGGAWAREFGTGWVAGTGVEWKFLPNLSFFAEYEYTSFASGNRTFASTIPPVSVTSTLNLQALLFGANFRFDWGPPVTTRY
jgi:outer membrane immunogenic protein